MQRKDGEEDGWLPGALDHSRGQAVFWKARAEPAADEEKEPVWSWNGLGRAGAGSIARTFSQGESQRPSNHLCHCLT